MTTIRKLLYEMKFDEEDIKKAYIIYQECEEDDTPGWAQVGFGAKPPIKIGSDHPILDKEFSQSYGGPEMPRIMIYFDTRIVFPVQYDGSTWLEWVAREPQWYTTSPHRNTIYPGQ